jgi:hypothetical protein
MAAPDEARTVTLYVRSKRVVTSFYRPATVRPEGPERAVGPAGGDVPAVGEEAFFLSDDQARALALTEEVATRRRWHVEVVDVAKVGRIEAFVAERLRGVENFPVLIAPGGFRLEGAAMFTEDHLCEAMPAEMPGQRAFTYVKIKGGNLNRIRDALLNFREVRELHLLTGDWDVFVVLEFPEGATNKRQILDFVTDRIRVLPDVLDTSTFVPEYSVTKFAF